MSDTWEYPGEVYEKIRSYSRDLSQELHFLESYGVNRGAKLLDIGCATGTLIRGLSKNGIDCVGIDPSKSFTDYAANKAVASHNPGSLSIKRGIVDRSEPNPDTYDFITCIFGVLPLLDSHDAVLPFLEEIRRRLRPGGRFFLEFGYYLNFVSNFQPTMVLNHFDDKENVSRLIKHVVHPHKALWQHDETITVGRQDSVELYFQRFFELVLLPPTIFSFLEKVGFTIIDHWPTWQKTPYLVGHSTLIIVCE